MKKESINCECGKKHRLETENIVVSNNAFSCFVKEVCSSNYNKICVMTSLEDGEIIARIKSKLLESGKEVSVIYLPNCLANIITCEKIEDKGQELVVAIGNEALISMAKYYAYSLDCKLFIYPTGNFCDYTFSKFARLYDGVTYNFYLTLEPERIYVSTNKNTYNLLHTYYISSKFIAVFDNLVQEMVFLQKPCLRQKEFLAKSLNEYMKTKPKDLAVLNERNIWTLIRLGQAMSFYGETKAFLGGDFDIANLLNSVCPGADFLELETLALKLVVNTYPCFYKGDVMQNDVNYNRHIQAISSLLKIPPTEVIKRMVGYKESHIDNLWVRRLSCYMPYLRGVLNKSLSKIFMLHSSISLAINVIKKNNLTYKLIEKCYALAANLSTKNSTLRMLLALGYMDKLL